MFSWEFSTPSELVPRENLPESVRAMIDESAKQAKALEDEARTLDFESGLFPWEESSFQVFVVLGAFHVTLFGREKLIPASIDQTVHWLRSIGHDLDRDQREEIRAILHGYIESERALRAAMWAAIAESESHPVSDVAAFGVRSGELYVLRKEDLSLNEVSQFMPFVNLMEDAGKRIAK